MEEKRKSKIAAAITILQSCLIVFSGVLFCLFSDWCNPSVTFMIENGELVSTAWDICIMSGLFGLYLIGFSIILFVFSFFKKKHISFQDAVICILLISSGFIIMKEHAITFVYMMMPYMLVGAGIIICVNAFSNTFWRKNNSLIVFVIKLLLGIGSIATGVYALKLKSLYIISAIVLSCIVMFLTLYSIVEFFIKNKKMNAPLR